LREKKEDSDNSRPDVIAQEIVEDLEAAVKDSVTLRRHI